MPFAGPADQKRVEARRTRPSSGAPRVAKRELSPEQVAEMRKRRMAMRQAALSNVSRGVDPSIAVPVGQPDVVGTQTPPIFVPEEEKSFPTRPPERPDVRPAGRPVVRPSAEQTGTQTPPIYVPDETGAQTPPIYVPEEEPAAFTDLAQEPAREVELQLQDPQVANMVRENMTPELLARVRSLPSAQDRALALSNLIRNLRRREALAGVRIA